MKLFAAVLFHLRIDKRVFSPESPYPFFRSMAPANPQSQVSLTPHARWRAVDPLLARSGRDAQRDEPFMFAKA